MRTLNAFDRAFIEKGQDLIKSIPDLNSVALGVHNDGTMERLYVEINQTICITSQYQKANDVIQYTSGLYDNINVKAKLDIGINEQGYVTALDIVSESTLGLIQQIQPKPTASDKLLADRVGEYTEGVSFDLQQGLNLLDSLFTMLKKNFKLHVLRIKGSYEIILDKYLKDTLHTAILNKNLAGLRNGSITYFELTRALTYGKTTSPHFIGAWQEQGMGVQLEFTNALTYENLVQAFIPQHMDTMLYDMVLEKLESLEQSVVGSH